jgi:lysophospholipase L1-like esterase
MRDLYFFGDSITYGAWDEQGGWVQRIRSSVDQAFISGRAAETMVYNQGIWGDTTADLVKRMDTEMAARFDPAAESVIVFAIGINDAHFMTEENKDYTTPEAFERNIDKLVGIARKYAQKIAFIGLNPVDENKVNPLPWNPAKSYRLERVKLFNSLVQKVASESNLFFVDIWKDWIQINYRSFLFDGLHPNASGHRRIAEKVNKFLSTGEVFSTPSDK